MDVNTQFIKLLQQPEHTRVLFSAAFVLLLGTGMKAHFFSKTLITLKQR